MKIVLSVADGLMLQADEAARELGLNRSGLIAEALREFLQKRREVEVLEQLNRAYAKDPQSAERKLAKGLKSKLPNLDTF